jgi:hypothetical protein
MTNPYNYHVPVRTDSMFFGREDVVARLLNGLRAPVPISAAILAGRRCGKTSLLWKLSRALSANGDGDGGRRFVPCYLDLQGGRPLASVSDFFLWALEILGETWETWEDLEPRSVENMLTAYYLERLSKGPVDAFSHALRHFLRKVKRVRLVLIVDESDRLFDVDWGSDLRPNLRVLLSNSSVIEDMALVMAGSNRMYALLNERDSPLENILDRYLLSTLSHEATVALALTPCARAPTQDVAEQIWQQTGGHPCLAQYILHELWDFLGGELNEATVEQVNVAARTFEDRTRHFSAWAQTVGANGGEVYDFLLQSVQFVPYRIIKSRFANVPGSLLLAVLDALTYHGLAHFQGQSTDREYQYAGKMFGEWFLQAGGPAFWPEGHGDEGTRSGASTLIVEGDYVAGNKPVAMDQQRQQVNGPQTNLDADKVGPVLSGEFRESFEIRPEQRKDSEP